MNKQKGSALIIALSALIVLSIVVIGTVAFLSSNSSKNVANVSNQPAQDTVNSGVVAPVEQTNTVSNKVDVSPVPAAPIMKKTADTPSPTQTTTTVKNCSDMSCFLLTAKTCAPAQGIVAYNNQPVLNFLMSGKTQVKITKGNNNMCVYYQKYLEASVKYSDNLRQSLLGQGKTLDEINTMEKMGNQSQQFAVGKESTCILTISDLVNKISENMDGSFHMSSEHPGCTGTLYETVTQTSF